MVCLNKTIKINRKIKALFRIKHFVLNSHSSLEYYLWTFNFIVVLLCNFHSTHSKLYKRKLFSQFFYEGKKVWIWASLFQYIIYYSFTDNIGFLCFDSGINSYSNWDTFVGINEDKNQIIITINRPLLSLIWFTWSSSQIFTILMLRLV
jgi:hypothetical protein